MTDQKKTPASAATGGEGSDSNTRPDDSSKNAELTIIPAEGGVYQASRIKQTRARRTRAQVEQLERQIIDVLRQDHPVSVRHVFYRMTDPTLPEPVEKTERGYSQVQDRLVKMRREGKVPYHWITDATRRGHFVNVYHSPAEALRHWQHYYRADLWADADFYLEVWTESRSIAGMVQDVCQEYAVSLYPCGGFSSLTLAYDAAQAIIDQYQQVQRPVVVLFIGDYDPAGVLIDQSVKKELQAHLPENIDFRFHRIGINPEQIEEYNLPSKPRKKGDRRAQHIERTVEAEAMPIGILRDLLRTTIEEHLPANALEVAKVAEQSEREGLLLLARAMEVGEV